MRHVLVPGSGFTNALALQTFAGTMGHMSTTIRKGLKVMECLAHAGEPQGISEIASRIGMNLECGAAHHRYAEGNRLCGEGPGYLEVPVHGVPDLRARDGRCRASTKTCSICVNRRGCGDSGASDIPGPRLVLKALESQAFFSPRALPAGHQASWSLRFASFGRSLTLPTTRSKLCSSSRVIEPPVRTPMTAPKPAALAISRSAIESPTMAA